MFNEKSLYDKQDIYKSEIRPLLDKVDSICRRESIPYFVTFATANNNETTIYANDGRMSKPLGIQLTQDFLIGHLQVNNGFEVVFPDTIPDIEFK